MFEEGYFEGNHKSFFSVCIVDWSLQIFLLLILNCYITQIRNLALCTYLEVGTATGISGSIKITTATITFPHSHHHHGHYHRRHHHHHYQSHEEVIIISSLTEFNQVISSFSSISAVTLSYLSALYEYTVFLKQFSRIGRDNSFQAFVNMSNVLGEINFLYCVIC